MASDLPDHRLVHREGLLRRNQIHCNGGSGDTKRTMGPYTHPCKKPQPYHLIRPEVVRLVLRSNVQVRQPQSLSIRFSGPINISAVDPWNAFRVFVGYVHRASCFRHIDH
jgi:hypothetical protein